MTDFILIEGLTGPTRSKIRMLTLVTRGLVTVSHSQFLRMKSTQELIHQLGVNLRSIPKHRMTRTFDDLQ